jgi:hypothetical protein
MGYDHKIGNNEKLNEMVGKQSLKNRTIGFSCNTLYANLKDLAEHRNKSKELP